MKNHHSLLFVLLSITLSFFTTSCVRETSDSVSQDKIYTDYELFYNANEDKTYARATFRFSNALGTNLELADGSEVRFEGDVLTFNEVLAYYEREYAGFKQSGTFEWDDLDGNTFSNSISINSIEYPDGIDSIGRENSFEISWVGDALDNDETVTVTINGENEGDAKLFINDDIGSSSIILDMDKLEGVGEGPGKIWMDRSYSPVLMQETSSGGKITGRFRPENLEVIFN